MKKWVTILLVSMVIIFTTSAIAMSHDHHDSHHSVSPFDKTKVFTHHCALNGHTINNPCPHLLKVLKSPNLVTISVDCGGAPFKKQPLPDGAKKQKVFSEFGKNLGLPDRFNLCTSNSDYSFILHNPLLHPPRFI